jgi:hypothetical protein
VRALAGAVLGAAIGAVQFGLYEAGTHAVERRPDLSGVGTAAGYFGTGAVATLLMMFVVARLLNLRVWGLAALVLAALDGLGVALLWGHLSVFDVLGPTPGYVLIAVVVVEVAVAGAAWPARAAVARTDDGS